MKLHKHLFTALIISFMVLSVSAQTAKKGSTAPDFSLKTSEGKTLKLSDYKGKAVLLHFWATWCPPCRKELPGMEKLYKKLQAQGDSAKLAFLGICISDTAKNQSSFMKKNNYTFLSCLDETDEVAILYNIQGVPTSILVSPEGKILSINVGMMSEKQLADFVKDYAQ